MARRPKLLLSETHTASCFTCDVSYTTEYQYKCLDWLYNHVKRKHPSLFASIDKKAQEGAFSQVGL